MNDHSAPPMFRAWFPHISAAAGELAYTWYVSAANAPILGDGCAEISAHLLETAGLAGAPVRGWTVSRVCTPFFTGFPNGVDWRERYTVSWRYTVHTPTPAPEAPPPFDGLPVPMADSGQPAQGGTWEPGEEDCEVIAAVVDTPGFAGQLQERFADREVSTWDHPIKFSTITIGRVRLGRLMVAENTQVIDEARHACAALGAAVYLDAYHHLFTRVRHFR